MTPTPAPGLAFVRRVQTEETYRGSAILIPEAARDKIADTQYEVVSVGLPEPCEDEDCERRHDARITLGQPESDTLIHRCYVAPGDWVLIRKRSAMPTPEPDLYVIRQADCIGRFEVRE